MIGNQQKKQLASAAASLALGEPKECHIVIRPHRYFTREGGGGHGFPIVLRLVHGPEDVEHLGWLSKCTEHYSAIDKAKELARYLRDELSVKADCIRVRDESGTAREPAAP